MLRPSRPALLPQHRFQLHNAAWRAGTAQTLQAAQGQARGRGQAGFWGCAPNPEVTAEDVQKLEARIAQIENGQVSGQIQNEEVTGLEARIAQIEGVTKDVKTWTKAEILKIHSFLDDNFDTSSMHRESDQGNLVKTIAKRGNPAKVVDRIPKFNVVTPDDTGDGNKAAAAAAPFALRKSGYGDLRV